MYSIYVHTTPDGRKYVGSTSLEPKRRFHGGSLYRKHIRFYNAIKFFGWYNIEHQVLETVEDKETALKREEYYTLLWRTNEPEFGYNIYAGYIPNEEIINKRLEKIKKHIMMKNIKTGEILKFDSREKCAEFFCVTTHALWNFITGKRPKSITFKDYEVLSK